MGKMTPGPWEAVHSDPAEGANVFWLVAPQGNGPHNGEVELGTLRGDRPANARAIAALPDVLEALRDARDNGLIYWEPQSARGVEQKALMLARIDAALARAAGRPSHD